MLPGAARPATASFRSLINNSVPRFLLTLPSWLQLLLRHRSEFVQFSVIHFDVVLCSPKLNYNQRTKRRCVWQAKQKTESVLVAHYLEGWEKRKSFYCRLQSHLKEEGANENLCIQLLKAQIPLLTPQCNFFFVGTRKTARISFPIYCYL